MCALLVAALLAAVLLAGCGADDEPVAPAQSATQLLIAVDPDGDGPKRPREHELSCPGGSGCDALARVPSAAYRPVPSDRVCTGLFGGSETARVSGRLDGRPLDARFSRQNGCETARWDDAEPLLALAP